MASASVSLLKTPGRTFMGKIHGKPESKNLVWELPFVGDQLLQEPHLMGLCQSSFLLGTLYSHRD